MGAKAILTLAAFVLLGLVFGSFGTVAAHRIPLRESIVSGRSRCPHCRETIRWWQNIPVASYVLQRGRCMRCGARIALRYPLMEAGTGALFALCAWRFDALYVAAVYAACSWVLVVLSVIDIDHHLLPNRVVLPSAACAWLALSASALALGSPERVLHMLAGGALFSGFLALIAFANPAWMGFGDVKLALLLGAMLGFAGSWPLTLAGMFLSFFFGAAGGALLMIVTGASRKSQVPFGPYLALGAMVAVVFGEPLVAFYRGLVV